MSGHADCDALFRPLVDNGAAWCAPNIHAEARWLDVDGVKWRVSSVLHPTRTAGEWERAIDVARSTYGSLPIVVRCLDDVASVDLRAALSRIGLQMVPSRLVFHQDPRRDDFWRIRNVRHDVALASRRPMASRALTTNDCPRIAELYWLLYGHKHSTLNPEFQSEWLAHGMRSGAFRGDGIEYGGQLVAAFLSYGVGDMMTNPVFGYDTALPQELGLYRRLSLLTMYAARRDGLRIHASSGAPGFKASRGGGATMEYHAVDLRSVRGAQRAAWTLQVGITAAVAPALFKRAR